VKTPPARASHRPFLHPFVTRPSKALLISRSTGVGLDRDVEILESSLRAAGLSPEVRRPRGISLWARFLPPPGPRLPLVFVERIHPRWLSHGQPRFLVPNQERFPRRHLARLKHVDHVLCKTAHARERFAPHHPSVHHLGFTSRDLLLANPEPDYRRFLHLAGRSTLKGTEDLLALWAGRPDWPPLVLVIDPRNAPAPPPANVQQVDRRLDTRELRELQNRCGIHLCPSRSEGWGHYLVEAASCRAVVLTTDGPPMNEIITPARGVLVRCSRSEPRHLGTNYYVDRESLAGAVDSLLERSPAQLAALGAAARAWFEENDRRFRTRSPLLLQSLLGANP